MLQFCILLSHRFRRIVHQEKRKLMPAGEGYDIAIFCFKEGLAIRSSKGVVFLVKVIVKISATSLRCLHEDRRVVLISSIACAVRVEVIYQHLGFCLITPIE